MGQPKRRTSKSRKNIRRGAIKLTSVLSKKCKKCNADVLPHRVCTSCGNYNT